MNKLKRMCLMILASFMVFTACGNVAEETEKSSLEEVCRWLRVDPDMESLSEVDQKYLKNILAVSPLCNDMSSLDDGNLMLLYNSLEDALMRFSYSLCGEDIVGNLITEDQVVEYNSGNGTIVLKDTVFNDFLSILGCNKTAQEILQAGQERKEISGYSFENGNIIVNTEIIGKISNKKDVEVTCIIIDENGTKVIIDFDCIRYDRADEQYVVTEKRRATLRSDKEGKYYIETILNQWPSVYSDYISFVEEAISENCKADFQYAVLHDINDDKLKELILTYVYELSTESGDSVPYIVYSIYGYKDNEIKALVDKKPLCSLASSDMAYAGGVDYVDYKNYMFHSRFMTYVKNGRSGSGEITTHEYVLYDELKFNPVTTIVIKEKNGISKSYFLNNIELSQDELYTQIIGKYDYLRINDEGDLEYSYDILTFDEMISYLESFL